MRTLLIIFSFFSFIVTSYSQTRDEIVTKRAREFHRVLVADDREVWRKFMTENYSKALLDRSVKAQVSTDGGAPAAAAENKQQDPMESKLAMFQRMHDDFGKSTIMSVVPSGDEVDMVLSSSSGLGGTFKFRFQKEAPYLIDGIGVEVSER